MIIARETSEEPRLLLLSEPTQGLDIKAADYVYGKLLHLRNTSAVVFSSSDLDEIMKMSDRIVVMYRGKIVFDRENSSLTKEEITDHIIGLKTDF